MKKLAFLIVLTVSVCLFSGCNNPLSPSENDDSAIQPPTLQPVASLTAPINTPPIKTPTATETTNAPATSTTPITTPTQATAPVTISSSPTPTSTEPEPKGVRFWEWTNDTGKELTTAEVYASAKKDFDAIGKTKMYKLNFLVFMLWASTDSGRVLSPGNLVVALGEKEKLTGGYRGATLKPDRTIEKIVSVQEPENGKWATDTIFLFYENIY